ncbi:MAG: TonB-dependent receptor [Sphingomonadaceae bacterium]|nr:TonB-dependent receptor [Sphingomonadaceae bacterium]
MAAPTATPTTSNGQLGEIVVTAQRRAESLQRVPLAVTALDSRALEARGITNLGNLQQSVSPGVVVTQFAGTPSTLSFNIRGAYSADPGIGLAEQGVAVYEDGVPLGRAVGTGIELGDIERIELLRGPQGTLFGRNAEGGAVQFITKRPTGELGGRLEVQQGNYDAHRIMGVLNLPEFHGFSVKLSGLWDSHDGYTRNLPERTGTDQIFTGKQLPDAAFHQEDGNNFQDLGYKRQRGFRIAVQWQPTDNLSAYYTFDYSDLNYTVGYNSRTGGRVPSAYAWCQNPAYAATCASAGSIISNIYYGTPSAQPLNPKYADVPTYTPESTDHVRAHALTIDWHPSDKIEIKSITGLRHLNENGFTNLGDAQVFVQTIPTSAFAANVGQTAGFTGTLAPAEIFQKQFSEEAQLLGSFGDLKLTAGLFYYYERVFDTRSSFFSMGYRVQPDGSLAAFALAPFDINGTGADGLPNSLQKFLAKAHSYAAYAQATYTPSAILDGRLSLTGGLRYTKDKKFFDRLRAAAGATGANTSLFDKDRFDPAVTLAFQATPKINFYARYARAYRAGGTGIRNKLALTTYLPEVNTTYEVGAKTTLLDNHLRFNVAAFHSIIHNSQVSFQNSAVDPSSTDTVNVHGNIKINGVEVESTAQLTRALSASVGYSYMHASFGGATVGGEVSNGLGAPPTFVSYAITHAPYLPAHQLNLSADYVRPIGEENFYAHIEYDYMSRRHNNPTPVIDAQEAEATLSEFNGRLGLRDVPLAGAKLGIELYCDNLFNKHDYSYPYAINGSDFTVGIRNDPGGSAYAMPPRTFGIKGIVSF